MGGGADFVVQTNLLGAHNCFELARRDGAQVVFLSTSRVYPVAALSALALREDETRFELDAEQPVAGRLRARRSPRTSRSAARARSTARRSSRPSCCSTEYADSFGVRAMIDRCGVIAGPWQMGKVDQGVFTHWLLAHRLGRPLTYIGYGGSGKQVRDLLHVDDLCDLIAEQLADPAAGTARPSTSAAASRAACRCCETTELCRELTGNEVPIEPVRRGAAGRRAALRVGLPRAVRAHGLAADARAADDPRGHAGVDRGATSASVLTALA